MKELWELFPVVLTSHNPMWKEWAKEEMEMLSNILSDHHPVINHIGSTAIPDIMAKPIVDILVETAPETDPKRIKETMESYGYICMQSSASRMSFNKGYTPDGFAEKVFHIHFHAIGDNDEIYFRDYLTDNPQTAREYESLKRDLAPKYRNDRDGYTEAKSEFVKRVTDIAKAHTAQRHNYR